MKRISIITLQNIRNYGSVLQALATQKIFSDLGCEADFYNYHRPNVSSVITRIKSWTKPLPIWKKFFIAMILFPSFLRQKRIFESFISEHINQQGQRVCCMDDFVKLKHSAEIFCTGSDQTWNSKWNGGILPEMYLDFAPPKAKKIAYAASIGKNKLDADEIKLMRKYLASYDAISVRESSAVDILNNQLNIASAIQVLDPTLQVSREFWMSLLTEKQKNPKNKKKYVLLYQLNANKEMDCYAKEFAKKKGWPLIRFCTRYDQILKNGKSAIIPKVTDFISMIANAGCVITDSFHATAFCCNMNTPMISIYPKEFGGRLASLMRLLHLEERHLENYNDFSFVDRCDVDFRGVNETLEIERKVGLEFLRKAVE